MHNDPSPDLFRPISSDQFLPAISLWTTLGGLFLVGTVGIALVLAAVTHYNVTVTAPATVRPAGDVRLVQAGSEGVVKKIVVKENQVVKSGDAIAYIDSSQLETKKSQLLGTIHQNNLQLSQIAAQVKTLQTQIAAESNSMQRAIAAAAADLRRNQRDYQDQKITTFTQVQEAEAALELAKEEMKRYQQLGNTGAIAILQIKEKEQAYKAALAKLERAKAGLNPSNATVTIANERIAQEKAKGESTLATLKKEQAELIRRQVEIQNQINSDQKELTQVSTELQKTVIRTSEAGTILKLEIRNTGQVVRAGDAIAQISPNQAPLVVKARVAAADISKVRLCKTTQVTQCTQGKVIMRVSAYPYPDYGTLNGAVRGITADAITPQTNSNVAAVPYYEVTIEPDKLELIKGNQSYTIQPGMEVTADIIAQEETVLTFMLRKARLLTDL
ncbi:secretion protein HlyD [Tolypothrix tenuis PCC 7101]|uniref:Secretion protein HlyD n=1 Tax=Tolypothrix tenuis PCC 7101 TaxID=231146 RepID=A0A1Z4N6G3_9CYAN|nr:HlyD family efflux transporter periplasmic adaptor subunit [Aulosira sp. FACHB-113]BAZ01252.1 secretion protein HlyD [Tolypothrix tenuis PCC 7101]BAZ74825.1 secretion protein HlyD [Aulosira laxa NIES-50]